jgi:hypothetical protein
VSAPPRDPRDGMFETLVPNVIVMGGTVPKGPWTLTHIGFGEHGFVNEAGDFMPTQNVLVARRKALPR